jgi:glycerophosphoryl diester phosphodiesterase
MDMHPRTHPGRPLILAHRGASHHAPQNTMAAFRLAAEMGADGIELDVHLSRDGHAVVIHNETVEGTTNGSGRVADLSLGELQELDAGGWRGAAYAGERIPTLAGVLGELGPRLIVNVEIKTQALFSNDLEAEVVRLIEDHSMVHRVVVSSFSPFALWRVRRLNPNIPTGLLYSPDLPLALRKRWFQPLAQPKALHPRWDMIDRGFVSRAHGQGLAVNTWTCNTPDGMRQLIDWGVDAIITDRPDLLYELLSGRPHSHQRDR